MYKPTEQDREPRIKPMHIWSSHLQKVSKLLNGERIASSTNDAWKTEPRSLSLTLCKKSVTVTSKLLEEIIGKTLEGMAFSIGFQ
jgi:hypothetical protein